MLFFPNSAGPLSIFRMVGKSLSTLCILMNFSIWFDITGRALYISMGHILEFTIKMFFPVNKGISYSPQIISLTTDYLILQQIIFLTTDYLTNHILSYHRLSSPHIISLATYYLTHHRLSYLTTDYLPHNRLSH